MSVVGSTLVFETVSGMLDRVLDAALTVENLQRSKLKQSLHGSVRDWMEEIDANTPGTALVRKYRRIWQLRTLTEDAADDFDRLMLKGRVELAAREEFWRMARWFNKQKAFFAKQEKIEQRATLFDQLLPEASLSLRRDPQLLLDWSLRLIIEPARRNAYKESIANSFNILSGLHKRRKDFALEEKEVFDEVCAYIIYTACQIACEAGDEQSFLLLAILFPQVKYGEIEKRWFVAYWASLGCLAVCNFDIDLLTRQTKNNNVAIVGRNYAIPKNSIDVRELCLPRSLIECVDGSASIDPSVIENKQVVCDMAKTAVDAVRSWLGRLPEPEWKWGRSYFGNGYSFNELCGALNEFSSNELTGITGECGGGLCPNIHSDGIYGIRLAEFIKSEG